MCFIIPFYFFKSANEGIRGLGVLTPWFSNFFLFYFFEKESADGCKAKNHKYWVPSFGELIVLSSVKS